jgi:hypothetical protein
MDERLFNLLLPHAVASYLAALVVVVFFSVTSSDAILALCAPIVIPITALLDLRRLSDADAHELLASASMWGGYVVSFVATRWACVRKQRTPRCVSADDSLANARLADTTFAALLIDVRNAANRP